MDSAKITALANLGVILFLAIIGQPGGAESSGLPGHFDGGKALAETPPAAGFQVATPTVQVNRV